MNLFSIDEDEAKENEKILKKLRKKIFLNVTPWLAPVTPCLDLLPRRASKGRTAQKTGTRGQAAG